MNTNKTLLPLGPAIVLAILVLTACLGFTGCQTTNTPPKMAMDQTNAAPIILREGDVLRITFPGSPNLDTAQPIRRDGKLNLPLIGEVTASGMTPADLQNALVQAYANQISTKEVIVQVQSSPLDVFVSGEVMHPGEINSDHPLTALEAVMKAGGPNPDSADLKHVKIARNVNGKMQHYVVDLKSVLSGPGTELFYLQPGDIVVVPQSMF